MHSYQQQWQAKRGTWDALIENQERAKDQAEAEREWERGMIRLYGEEYGRAVIEQERARKSERQALQLRRQAQDRVLMEYLGSLTPKNDWVGAAWVDTEGNIYPVRYCNHTSRAEELAPHHFKDEITRLYDQQGYIDYGEFLSERKGWLRIGSDGLVGDHSWNRVAQIPNAQFDAIWEMHERGKVRGAHDYRETGGFVGGLRLSIRFAMGEVNECGETPEEVRRRHEEERERRERWAREDAEIRARAAERDARWAAERAVLAAPSSSSW